MLKSRMLEHLEMLLCLHFTMRSLKRYLSYKGFEDK